MKFDNVIYKKEKIFTAWKEIVLLPIYKGNGNIQDYKNYVDIKRVQCT